VKTGGELAHQPYTEIWSSLNGPRMPAPIRTVAIGTGAGAAVAWILESSGHSVVAIALLAACSILAAYLGLIWQPSTGVIAALTSRAHRKGPWTRYSLALLLTTCGIFLDLVYGHGLQHPNYVALLPAIVLSGAVLGFGPGLVAAGAGVGVVDLIFGMPSFYGSISSWKLIWPVLASSALGGLLAFGFLIVLTMYDDTVGD
jgi:hypothetical protein